MDLFTHCIRCGVMFIIRNNFVCVTVREDIPDDDITDDPAHCNAFCYECERAGHGENGIMKVVLRSPKSQ